MPSWRFSKNKKRRRDSVGKEKETLLDSEKPGLDRPPSPPLRKRGLAASPLPSATEPIPIPRRSSKRPSALPLDADPIALPQDTDDEELLDPLPDPLVQKENVPPHSPRPIISKESITALPMAYKLQYSPHLRPVDMERPHIPYNFRHSASQVSMPAETPPSAKANVLRKKRSSYDSGTPKRARSHRTRREEQVREEEIRAMSAHSPIPKRPGEGPLRRDSKKMRSGMRGSEISLPAHEESIHESLPSISEQRGWEIGAIDLFNPRPAVRLSGVPQYASTQKSLRTVTPTSPRLTSKSDNRPVTRDSAKKRDTIGSRADNLDSTDIRMLLERDAKRREQRKMEQQEKLDRKLRKREGRNRGDSDRRKREEDDRRRAENEALAKESLTTPIPPVPDRVHPALRPSHLDATAVGLGIGAGAAAAVALDHRADEPHDVSPLDETDFDPFVDPAGSEAARRSLEHVPSSYAPSELHMDEDDAVVETAQAVTMSQTSPPLSPVHSTRASSNLSRIAVDSRRASDIINPAQAAEARRAPLPPPERRTGALASLFRRSATQPKKGFEAKSPPYEASFSNTSRESMRGQPLPPHLVDNQPRLAAVRTASGTPARTQSKFREDLPEFPTPPDSRTASPDASGAAAAARRAQISSQYIDAQRQGSTTTSGSEAIPIARYDTPISPSLRPGTSLASVDSEGAWLASGNSMKRQSRQSGLNTRRADFATSYEELGTDTDGQHFSRGTSSPETVRGGKQRADSNTFGTGASETTSITDFYDAPEEPESPTMTAVTAGPSSPMVHGTVRRRPTLVKSDSRHRSREGLVTEMAAGDTYSPGPASATTGRGSLDMDSDLESPEPEVQRATSVRVAAHGRNVSTGSAKLMEYSPRLDPRSGREPSPLSPRFQEER